MSDTPRTDNACGWPWGHHGRIESSDLRWSPDGPFVHSEVARQLERENAALRTENQQLRKTEALAMILPLMSDVQRANLKKRSYEGHP